MRKLAGNDAAEVWSILGGSPRHTACRHERVFLDSRAQLMVDLVKVWGHGLPVAEAMHDAHQWGNPMEATDPKPPSAIVDIVMKAAVTVDAIYDEARRRGWVLDLPSFDELAGE